MKKHEKIARKNQTKTESKPQSSGKQDKISPQNLMEQTLPFAIGDTPYLPSVQRHSEMLSNTADPQHRALVFRQLQQTYGNNYVQRLMRSSGSATMQKTAQKPVVQRVTKTKPTGGVRVLPPVSGKSSKPKAPKQDENFGMVLEPTFLQKPNSAGTARQRSWFKKNRIGAQLNAGDSVQMLDTKTSDKGGDWQLAVHPQTGEKGFIRVNLVMVKGAKFTPGSEMNEALTEKKKEQTAALADIIKDLINEVGNTSSGVGGNFGDDMFGNAAEMLMLKDPSLAWNLSSDNWESKKKELSESLANNVPWLKNSLGSDIAGFAGTGMSITGDVLGVFTGLWGMAKGISDIFGTKSDMEKRLEGILTTGTSGLGVLAGGAGITEKVAGTVNKFTSDSTTEAMSGILKPIGSGISTVKGIVEMVGMVIKGFKTVIDNAKKGAKLKFSEIISAVAEFAGTAAGTIKSAVGTVAGVFSFIKALPGVSTVLGIVGSVLDIIGSVIDFFKDCLGAINLGVDMKKNKDKVQQIEDNEEYNLVERNMLNKVIRLSDNKVKNLTYDKDNKPANVLEIEAVVKDYEGASPSKKNERTEKDYKDVKGYVVDRGLLEILKKRVNRSLSKIPEFVMSLIADGISFVGGLVSLGADIAAILSAPTGIGAAIATATKAISSTASSLLAGGLKLGKGLYGLIRTGVRKIKQHARDKGWGGTNQSKTSQAKHQRRVMQTQMLMGMVADLPSLKEDKSSKSGNPLSAILKEPTAKEEYERVKLRLEASGVDLKELFGLNGKPADQAKKIYEALAKRE